MKVLTLKVEKKNGLHVRFAASFISTLQMLTGNKDKLKEIYAVYKGKKVQVNNLLSLVSLRIQKGEEFCLLFDKSISDEVIKGVQQFFKQVDQEQEKSEEIEADRLVMENSITLQEAIAGLPSGIVVVDRDNIITYINEAAAKLLNKGTEELINKQAELALPYSRLDKVMANVKPEIARKQKVNNNTLLINYSPLTLNGQVIGAVAVFQDISHLVRVSEELKQIQELQHRLNLVLQSVNDLIGMTNEAGQFIYCNDQMALWLSDNNKKNNVQSIMGEEKWKSLTDNHRPFIKVIKFNDQLPFITKIKPIVIQNQFCGTVVTLSPLDEVKVLLQKLDMMEKRAKYLEAELSKHQKLDKAFNKIIGNNDGLLESLSVANKVSKTDSTVIITGESGTGKELVARAIHETSDRRDKPYVRVNCAAIPKNLIESELFGYEKGAFTGAHTIHRGKFELANKGTIFLDEIGDLNVDLQVKLLRVLQEKEVERIGGNNPIPLDVRVIAATHQDLGKMVQEGKFREDLYYRLNVIPVHLPPLRSRIDDIPLLVEHFREHFNQKLGKKINGYEPGFIEVLINYNWPGNIRELVNIIERIFNLTDDQQLCIKDLPNYIKRKENEEGVDLGLLHQMTFKSNEPLKILTLEEYEKQIFSFACLHYPSFNQLAQALGITHKTAAKKIRKYGLETCLGKKYQEI